MSLLTYVLVAGMLTCFLAMIAIAARSPGEPLKQLPPLEPATLLAPKEAALYADLSALAQKLHLSLFVGLSLGQVVRPTEEARRAFFFSAASAKTVPFLLADPRTHRPLVAVLPAGAGLDPVVERALDAASLPFIPVGNYNPAGLEKAVREKLPALRIPPAEEENTPGDDYKS